MSQSTSCEEPRFPDLFRLMQRFGKLVRRSMNQALQDCPRCHFAQLERLHFALQKYGDGETIYVSVLARALHESMPSISRTLRMLEQDGLVARETDPADRRKTRVRITDQGNVARLQCEEVLRAFWGRVTDRLGPQRLAQLCEDTTYLLDAMEAELNADCSPDPKGDCHAEDF